MLGEMIIPRHNLPCVEVIFDRGSLSNGLSLTVGRNPEKTLNLTVTFNVNAFNGTVQFLLPLKSQNVPKRLKKPQKSQKVPKCI